MQVNFFEYQKKYYSEMGHNVASNAAGLKSFLESKHLGNSFEFLVDGIVSASYVGSFIYKGIQINVLPKILGGNDNSRIVDNFIYMLSYTRKLKLSNITSASLSEAKNPFIEILIAYYADELFSALSKNMPHSYENNSENLRFVRGKIDFVKDIRYNSFNKSKVFCNFDEFQEDNLLNRLFKFVALCLFQMTDVQTTKNKLSKILNFYQDVTFLRITSEDSKKIILNRGQNIFKEALKIAKLFLENSSINMSGRNFDTIAVLFDMERLFEEFIFNVIREIYPELTVEEQNQKAFIKNLIGNECADVDFRMNTKCDILIKSKNNNKIVIDTKYKVLEKDKESKYRISSADIYQMITYSAVYGTKDIILLYPTKANEFNHYVEFGQETGVQDIKIRIMTVNLHKDLKDNAFRNEFRKKLKLIAA